MKIYFSYEHIPEMADIPEKERRETWRSFSKSLGFFATLWRSIVIFFAFIIPFYLTVVMMEYYDKRFNGTALVIVFAGGIVFSFLSCLVTMTALYRNPFKKYIDEQRKR